MQQGQHQTQQHAQQRAGISTMPQNIQSAIVGIAGIAMFGIILLAFVYFLGTQTGRQISFNIGKYTLLGLAVLGILAYLVMWIKLAMSSTPTLIEALVPAVGLIIYLVAMPFGLWALGHAISQLAFILNTTL